MVVEHLQIPSLPITTGFEKAQKSDVLHLIFTAAIWIIGLLVSGDNE